MTGDEIRALEIAFLNAWSPLETHDLNGWQLRFTGGATRRANSVFPLDWHGHSLDADIRVVEKTYADQGLPPAFYLPPIVQPDGLDARLAARGYGAEGHVHVQTRAMGGLLPADRRFDFTLNPELTGDWPACYAQGSATPDNRAGRAAIMARVPGRRSYCVVREDGRAVGCGMAVQIGGWGIIQGMRTPPAFRGRGIGAALLTQLLNWAAGAGAKAAALQVEIDNPAALALYGKAGFTPVYDYHYRIKRAPR